MSAAKHNEGSTRAVWNRRFAYGANVGVLIVAVLVIVLLLNWLAARKVREWGFYARLDLTATRQYTLSPQTRKLLADLDQDVTVYTSFAGGAADVETVRRIDHFLDLLDEYELRSGGRVKVESVDPTDPQATAALAEKIRDRYAEQIAPARAALDQAEQAYAAIERFSAERGAWYATRFPMVQGQIEDEPSRRSFRQLGTIIQGLAEDYRLKLYRQAVADALEADLPDYEGAARAASSPLVRVKDQLLDPATEGFGQIADAADAKALKQFAVELKTAFEQLRDVVNKAIQALDAVDTGEYASTRRSINESNAAVILTDGGLTVIRLADVYTASMVGGGDEAAPEQRFRGEEAVTGAIVSLTMAVRPLVVFVSGQPGYALGPRGAYRAVADRLTNMNFEVTEWPVMGQMSAMGPVPGPPKPEPKEGQPVVWVFLPAPPPPDPRMPYNPAEMQIREQLAQSLSEGQTVLAFLAPSQMAGIPGADRTAAVIRDTLGVDVDWTRQILTSYVRSDGKAITSPQIEMSDWPTDHPISAAAQGQMGVMLSGLAMRAEPTDGVTAWPIIRTGADTWVENSPAMQDKAKRDPDERGGPVVAGLAIQRGDQRVVLIGDAFFAQDDVTQYGPVDVLSGQLVRAIYPANAELFVNSVYWLSHMERLIASGAQTQEARRIGAIADRERVTLWWIVMLGVPAATLAAGAGVWLVRRK